MATINHSFNAANAASQSLNITENSVVNVSAYTFRANTLTLVNPTYSAANPASVVTVTVNLPHQVSGFTDRLVVGPGLNLSLNSVGRWSVDAGAAASTNVTFSSNALDYATPSFIGSTTGANVVTVNSGATVTTATTGSAADNITVTGNVGTLTTGTGSDIVTATGKITTLTMGAGGNTVNLSGAADISTANIAGGTLTLSNSAQISTLNANSGDISATLGGTAEIGTLNIANGAGQTLIGFNGTNAAIDLISATGSIGPVTISGTGTLGRIDTGAGNEVIRITDTDFSTTTVNNLISTGAGDDSLTFGGNVTLQNYGLVSGAIDTGTGNDSISLTAGSRLETTGATARNIAMGDGNDSFTTATGSNVDIGTLNMGAGEDNVALTGTVFKGAIDLGADNDILTATDSNISDAITLGGGADRLTATNTIITGSIDAGDGADEIRITGGQTGKIVAGNGNDTLVLTATTINGNIDMGDGTDSLTIGKGVVPNVPDLGAHYAANPSATVNGDIDLGSGSGIQTLVVEDGVLINGTIFAGKSAITPVTSHVTIGDWVKIDDSEYSMSLGHGDDVVTIGNNSFIGGQILLNGGQNTLVLGENTWLSSSNVAIYGGTGDDHVTLQDGVLVKGAIALSAGNNTLLVGDNVTFTESGTIYSSADTGEGGADLIDFGSGVRLRGDIFMGWGNDVVSMTEAAVGAYEAGKPVISGGLGGESGEGDVLIVGDFFDTGVLAGKYSYDSTLNQWFANGTLPHEFTYNGVIYRHFETIKIVPTCFTPGTLIATAKGLRPIEDIAVGDMIPTRDSGLQPVRKILVTRFDAAHLAAHPRHLPVRIAAGALGGGLPERDLTVSPQHRVLLRSRIAERLTGSSEVLMPAAQLVGQAGITRVTVTEVTYLHLVFNRHELILSEGAVTEAFYPGPAALDGMDLATRRELAEIFPEITHAGAPGRPLARPELRGKEARRVLDRHNKHSRPLVA